MRGPPKARFASPDTCGRGRDAPPWNASSRLTARGSAACARSSELVDRESAKIALILKSAQVGAGRLVGSGNGASDMQGSAHQASIPCHLEPYVSRVGGCKHNLGQSGSLGLDC